MTVYQELMYNNITQAMLRRESRSTRKESKKQEEANRRLTQLRRATEDRAMARELGCEVSDFV
jgi:hypothetical protein